MMDRQILMLTGLYPKDEREAIARKSRSTMGAAMDGLQWNLISGIESHLQGPIDIVNMLPVYSFPKYYDDWYIKTRRFSHRPGANDVSVGYLNVQYIKHVVKYWGLYRPLAAWVSQHERPTIIVYTLNEGYLRALRRLKRRWPQLQVCAVVADLPAFSNLRSDQGSAMRAFNRWRSEQSQKLLSCVDSFVLLTEQMKDALHLSPNQRYCVVEGIASDPLQGRAAQQMPEDGIRRIVYTGTLHRLFGIEGLVKAFRLLPGEQYRLIICGTGDYEEEVKRQAKDDPRIDFRGIVSHDEVLAIQQTATVLVNPRQNHGEFTKYSFPSKTMEYLASGSPVVAYRLDGIPVEYDGYLNYPLDDTPEALASVLSRICGLSAQERAEMGERGRRFVLENKNPIKQTERVLKMLGER